jgi:hypothetical protein
MFVHFKRYARVYHCRRRVYGHVIAPGTNVLMVTFADQSGAAIQTPRSHLRYLRWYERLLNL